MDDANTTMNQAPAMPAAGATPPQTGGQQGAVSQQPTAAPSDTDLQQLTQNLEKLTKEMDQKGAQPETEEQTQPAAPNQIMPEKQTMPAMPAQGADVAPKTGQPAQQVAPQQEETAVEPKAVAQQNIESAPQEGYKITIYTTENCPYCKAEKEYLTQKNLKFEEKNVEGNEENLKEMLNVSDNFAGVPVTVLEGKGGKIVVKGFTQEDFDKELAKAQIGGEKEATSTTPEQQATPPVSQQPAQTAPTPQQPSQTPAAENVQTPPAPASTEEKPAGEQQPQGQQPSSAQQTQATPQIPDLQ